MTGVCCYLRAYPTQQHRRVDSFRCCSNPSNPNPNPTTPQVLKIAVAGVTELLRLFSSRKDRLETENYMQRNEVSVSNIDDVVMTLQSDYENAYFVTGIFTPAIYSEDCLFEDPTIKFRSTELYSRNLKLLVPFFDHPSIVLQKIEKGSNAETSFVLATWKLRTYLRLPWRPLISIDGSTVYDLDDKFK
ncbi:Ribose-phosphate pyrophosphokinase, partial [Actinidia chinensis var. chinensis]